MAAITTTRALPPQVLIWNDTRRDYPLDRPLTAFIEAQVKKTPALPAVICDAKTLTYGELNHRANQLAHHLIGRGVASDCLVGVFMERSIEMVVALLGIIKAGGAYVPFDPEYPDDRLSFMFADSQVGLVLTQKHLAPHALPPNIRAICLDDSDIFSQASDTAAEDPSLRAGPNDPVYMIYTSGSTGRPKGVPNIHRGLVNRILWMQEALGLSEKDRVLQKTPYSFDVSVWEFFWPLVAGACIVMAKPGGHRDNAYLIDTIVSQNVTTMHFVPSMLNLFVNSDGLQRITSLRQVISSGEALPLELTKRFFAKLSNTRLHNLYGPTEASIDVTHWECKPESSKNVVPIGFPIANTQMYILDDNLNPVPVGEVAELYIGGVGLARGYWNRPDLTRERFVADPFSMQDGARLYKTGDLARYLPDGSIEYLGRTDFQVKLRGFRIELGEIEAVLLKNSAILQAVVVASDDSLEDKRLVAYVVAKNDCRPSVTELRECLLAELPDYMVPGRFFFLDEMPLLPNGKVDRKALPKVLLERPELAEMYVAPRSAAEKELCRIWAGMLNIKDVGVRDNFFELGGNSLMAIRMSTEIRTAMQKEVPVVKVFQYPTVEKLASHLAGAEPVGSKLIEGAYERATRIRIGRFSGNSATDGVAVIGMVGRFPGASNIDELWRNLCNKVESITRFSLDELGPGIDDETKNDPDYVPTRGIVADADKFDAQFFGIGPLEAKAMDPQQRVFLELAWAALENAGYEPNSFPGMIGVYAGVGDNHYYPTNVLCHAELIKTVGKMIVGYGNEKDYIATRVSYCLNLTGPSVSANTGCSTSLLAIDNAFKSLIDFECDMALAGGVDIFVPQRSGQLYQEGGTFTRDGHCRPFDEKATGTMFCDGAGIVVLRRLEDAIAAGDRIYAVIRGIAKNNDGADKVSFLAPSVEGQAQVIALAQAQANVLAESISYVEAHGTGTPLGDPIEVEALTKAFRATTDKTQFCHLGSIKGNIGHPTIASGVAGFIKASLALHHEAIPATLHYERPNPKIDFERSPFVVVRDTIPWPRGGAPRRAGVSSFGFGGTNVHAVLEEAPSQVPSGPSRSKQLLLFSAKTGPALGRLRRQYAEFLAGSSGVNLADMAYTLVVGRRHHAHRDFVVCASPEEAVTDLSRANERQAPTQRLASLDSDVAFMFPGQGSQYVNMGIDLYRSEPVFSHWVNACCDILKAHLERDLRELLFPHPGNEAMASESLKDTYYTQPALFTIEYALAQFWMSIGIAPSVLIGHSVGEFVCACLSGVFALEDILPMVALRGRLIRGLPRGSMLSVRCAAATIQGRLPRDIQLAASNSPNLCVVAGPSEAIVAFSAELEREGLVMRQLHTSHAFHSAMMEPIVAQYIEAMSRVKVSKSKIPIMSTCTADWLTDETAASPEYWGRHLRMPVLFSEAASKLLKESNKVFLEVGPRDVLTTLVRQHVELDQRDHIVASLGSASKDGTELTSLLSAIGTLWVNGISLDWDAFYGREKRHRIPLPTYPFERKTYWLDPVSDRMPQATASSHHSVADHASGESADSAPDVDSGADGNPRIEERDEVMTALAALLQETLGIKLDSRGENTPFIALGADSLLLMQLARIVQVRLGLTVSFRQLVEQYSTPNLLAEAVRAARNPISVPSGSDSVQPRAAEAVLSPQARVVSPRSEPKTTSVGRSPVKNARLGRDERGQPAWFVPDPQRPGKYLKVESPG
jgi:amino acid adenylation domain-containing protein